MDEIKVKRLTIEIPLQFHKELKSIAALRNISVKVWVMRAIVRELARETL